MFILFGAFGAILISNPYLALVPATIFLFLYFTVKSKFILTMAIVWGLYALYETLNLLRITCSGECNIRVDLLLIYPLLLVFTVIGIIYSLVKMVRR